MPRKHSLTGVEMRRLKPIKRFNGDLFSLSVAVLPGSEVAKCACVVSKKVALKATVRNRIKRQCRAILAPKLPLLPRGAYVLNAKRGASGAALQDITRDIDKLIRALHS